MAGKLTTGPLLYLDWQMNSSFAQALFTKCFYPHLWELCLEGSCKQKPWKACRFSFTACLLDRHQSNNTGFWFKMRWGTVLESAAASTRSLFLLNSSQLRCKKLVSPQHSREGRRLATTSSHKSKELLYLSVVSFFGSRQNTEDQDHRRVIKGKTQNEK